MPSCLDNHYNKPTDHVKFAYTHKVHITQAGICVI